MRDWALYEAVAGGSTGVGAEATGSEDALNSPVGDDGYPRHLYDKLTGEIEGAVAEYWRSHDLFHFLETNWKDVGHDVVGKLHFSVGDRDEWFRDFGIRDLERMLEEREDPYCAGSFEYGRAKGHLWQQTTNAELVEIVAAFVVARAPSATMTV